jgi:hypothetical protein
MPSIFFPFIYFPVELKGACARLCVRMTMDRVEQYHTHTRIVEGTKFYLYPYPRYKTLPIPIGYPTDGSNTIQVTHHFTFIDSILRDRT